MRLWHYKLIPFLPNSQLIAQWRELNTIFAKQPNHILINYVYEYPKESLYGYTYIVIKEMEKRGYNITRLRYDNLRKYFGVESMTYGYIYIQGYNPFERHHDNRYLLQCFHNLQEKYDRGQKDFSVVQYEALERFINHEIH